MMIRLPITDKEGANDSVLYAASHSLEPLHVNKKELHTGHDQPGDIQGQYMSSFH